MRSAGTTKTSSYATWVQYVVLPLAIVTIWQLAAVAGSIKPVTLPSPADVCERFFELATGGVLARHIAISLLRVIEGAALALAVGVTLGAAIGLSQALGRLCNGILQVLKPIPPLAWIPLTILWFGIGEMSKVYLIFLGAVFPILVSVIDAIRQTDAKYVEVARVLETPRSKFIRQVVLPGALPAIMTGVRVGIGVAWMCVVAAEMIAASRGVGYMIMDARQLSQPETVIVGMLVIGVCGKLMDMGLYRLERWLIPWRPAYVGA